MQQDDELPEVEQSAEPETEAEQPDPREAELARLRAEFDRAQENNRKLTETLSQFVRHQPNQQPQVRDVTPDFGDAEEHGLTPAQARYLYGKIGAGIAPAIEKLKPQPRNPKELIEEAMMMASLNAEDNVVRQRAIGVIFDEADALRRDGISPDSPQGIRKLASALRKEMPQQNGNGNGQAPNRTAGIGGGSMPPGHKPKPAEKKHPTLYETIRTSQKKMGLY